MFGWFCFPINEGQPMFGEAQFVQTKGIGAIPKDVRWFATSDGWLYLRLTYLHPMWSTAIQ